MKEIDITRIDKINELRSELEFEKALALYKKMRWMLKEDPTLKPKYQKLKELILAYEKTNWSDENEISEQQINESDVAEKIVNQEEEFIYNRKEIIKKKLKKLNLNQQDLGAILGHKKNYMSELINGVRPFSKQDLVIIHRLLDIKLDLLIPTFIETEMINKINKVLEELKIEKLDLERNKLVLTKH